MRKLPRRPRLVPPHLVPPHWYRWPKHWRPGSLLGPASLGRRLIAGSALFTAIALVMAIFVMHHVLERFVTGQIDQRLDNKIVALASQLAATPDGEIHIVGDADGPPFDRRHTKSFWWVRGPKNDLHTRWLRPTDYTPPTDAAIAAFPAPPHPPPPPQLDSAAADRGNAEPPRTIDGEGLGGVALHVRVAQRMTDGTPVTILVAAPNEAIAGPVHAAMTTVGFALGGIGIGLFLTSLAQVRLGLRPLARLRADVEAVRAGKRTALPSKQPHEVLPLVTELNALLAQNAANLSRARGHVANLAHGLKTPLATLSLTVDRLDGTHRAPLLDLVATIEQRIRHHLGRARVAALDGPTRAQTMVAERVHDVADALVKIHADKAVDLSVDCPQSLVVACERQDVEEMIGNLLENAFKYTTRRIDLSARASGQMVVVDISDDGPGLRFEDADRVMAPGQRIDETVPGFGFGLSIARELAGLYGGTLTLTPRPVGLTATLILPRARS